MNLKTLRCHLRNRPRKVASQVKCFCQLSDVSLNSNLQLAHLLSRHRRMKAYKHMRSEVEALSEADLADMGIKRFQLGTVARKLALR